MTDKSLEERVAKLEEDSPATAAQNSWMRVVDSTGAVFWVPVWK
jgi:hypothetical protein